MRLVAPAILVLILCVPAGACPTCDTGTGQQVRAGILDADFGRTLLAVVLPFPVLLAFVACIHFGWLPFRRTGIASTDEGLDHVNDPPSQVSAVRIAAR